MVLCRVRVFFYETPELEEACWLLRMELDGGVQREQ